MFLSRGLIYRALRISTLNNKYPALHGIRFMSAFLILGYHVKPWPTQRLEHIWFGMDVLFVMSGFLIGLILLYSFEHRTGLARFYLRRGFRTFPLYFVVLTIATIAFPEGREARPWVWREFVYLTNYYRLGEGPYVMFWGWSLAVEEHFYLVCPVIVLLLGKINHHRQRLSAMVAVVVLSLTWRFAFLQMTQPSVLDVALVKAYHYSHFRMDELMIGIIAGYLTYYHPAKVRTVMNRPLWKSCVPTTIFLCFLACFFLPIKSPVFALGFSIAGIGYFALILYVVNVPSALVRFLSHRVFLYLASLTYGLYLVHTYVARYVVAPFVAPYFALLFANGTIVYWAFKILATICLSLSVSYVAHILVEKPILVVRDWLTK